MYTYQIFYKKYGVRRPGHLITRALHPFTEFASIKRAVYIHDSKESNSVTVPTMSFIDVSQKIPIFVPELPDSGQIENGKVYARHYTKYLQLIKKNRDYRYYDAVRMTIPEKIPVVLDTQLAHYAFKHYPSRLKSYYIWLDRIKYTLRGIKETKDLDREYFWFLKPERDLVTFAELNRWAKEDITPTQSNIINTDWKRFFIHLYRYVHSDVELKNKSIFSSIPEEVANRINFVIVDETNKFIILSLRLLKEWAISNTKLIEKALLFFFIRVAEHIEIDEDEEEIPIEKLVTKSLKEINKAEAIASSKKLVDKDEVDPKTLVEEEKDADDVIKEQASILLDQKVIGKVQYKNIVEALENKKRIKDPYGEKKTAVSRVVENIDTEIQEEEIALPIEDIVPDKSMAKNVIRTIDKKYLKEGYKTDVVKSTILSLEKTGAIVEDYKIEKKTHVLGDKEIHEIKVRPIDGKPSIIKFELPVITEDGELTMGGTKYRLRRQRTDLPIRKIRSNIVALTSFYGKVMIKRSPYKRQEYAYWLYRKMSNSFTAKDNIVTDLRSMNIQTNEKELPFLYTGLSKYVGYTTINGIEYIFDYDNRGAYLGIDPKDYEKKGSVVIGKKGKAILIMTKDNEIKIVKDGKEEPYDSFAQQLGVDMGKAPVDGVFMNLYGKAVPLGIVLSYYIGFINLLKYLNVSYYVIGVRDRLKDPENEYALRLNDKKYVFKRGINKENLIIGSMTYSKNILSSLTEEELNEKSVFLQFMTTSQLRELDMLDSSFIDPITKDILRDLKEPETFRGLLIRSAELMTIDYHPYLQDMDLMLIRGYERIPGLIYKELTKAVRDYKQRNVFGNSKIEMSPYTIWNTIQGDSAKSISEELNPVGSLKLIEEVTYLGEGGRSRETMSESTRKYHTSDLGVISEATKDSGDVGISAGLSANPNIRDIRGRKAKPFDIEKDGPASLLSTSAMLAVGSDTDDPKRVGFVSIQNSHVVPIEGQVQPKVRTGYDYVLPYKVESKYVLMAEEDGVVKNLTKKNITVEYKNGESGSYKIGVWYSRPEAGSAYMHELVTDLKKGDKFKKGDPIYYDRMFFEKDWLYDDKIVYKQATLMNVALMETDQTFEDSSAITKKATEKLTSEIAKVHTYTLPFTATISDMVKVGDRVKTGDNLFIYAEGSLDDGLDEDTRKALAELTTKAPSSKYIGTIDKVIMYWNGNMEDMSPSLKKLAEESNKTLSKELGKKVDGNTDGQLLVEGRQLGMNEVVIYIYVKIQEKYGLGDKGIFANQMKTVTSEVIQHDITTEDGTPIDALFGDRSVYARIVLSPMVIGTTNKLLTLIKNKAVAAYFGDE